MTNSSSWGSCSSLQGVVDEPFYFLLADNGQPFEVFGSLCESFFAVWGVLEETSKHVTVQSSDRVATSPDVATDRTGML
jgi:hypothetical protein